MRFSSPRGSRLNLPMEALELMRQIVYGYDPATTDFKEFLRLLNSNNGEQWPR